MSTPHDGSDSPLHDHTGNPLRLLMVHAHPDDETTTTGATAARYAAEGIGVHLVTCTRGERGEILDEEILAAVGTGGGAAEALGAVRTGELAAAATAIGFAGLRFLGGPGRWWDSGMAGEETNADPRALAAGDRGEQVGELAAVIRELRPQVLVTYDERGGYGHPDHIRAHELSMAAVKQAADAGAAAGSAPPWAVAKVYAAVVPHGVLRRAAQGLGLIEGPNPFADLGRALADGEPDAPVDLPFGVPDDLVAARVDARSWLTVKVAAMREHRSQMAQNGWFFALAEGSGGGFGVEHFQLLHGSQGPVSGDEGLEADLFAGLRAPGAVLSPYWGAQPAVLLRLREKARAGFEERLTRVGALEWELPTPCAGWSVRDLVAHVVNDELVAMAYGAQDEALAKAPRYEDAAAGWKQLTPLVDEVWHSPGVWEQQHRRDPFGQLPARLRLWIDITELSVHTWDLDRALGGDGTAVVDEELVRALAEVVTDFLPTMQGAGLFGPGIDPPAGADAQDLLLSRLGRSTQGA
jgi:N-acetyl-1-D-myo-inositol-2-amino-2-deoxy-alpha-D-glucopyranoside deacetylase